MTIFLYSKKYTFKKWTMKIYYIIADRTVLCLQLYAT